MANTSANSESPLATGVADPARGRAQVSGRSDSNEVSTGNQASKQALVETKVRSNAKKLVGKESVRKHGTQENCVPVEASNQAIAAPGIPISDRSAEVLRFLTCAEGDAGPRKVVRQYLEAEERRTRDRHHGKNFAGFDAMLAPLADRLEALQAEVACLQARAQATNLWDWAEFLATKPPSAAAVALMLVSHEREQKALVEQALQPAKAALKAAKA